MPQNFIECDREQELLLPPSLRDWLPDDHLAWFVADAVEEIDLVAFYGAYRQDGWGRAAFEPKLMVSLLLYAYAVGERSSRGIERRCREDVAFRVLAANQIPDHATIARFRARHEQALADTFEQVLALCARAGLVSVGLVALDGSLISGNASQGATRAYPQIRAEVERMLCEAAETDEREDAELGDARGDELPVELRDRRSRRERLARCKAELEREHDEEQKAHEENLAWRAAWEAEHGRKLGGRKPKPPDPDALAKLTINTTDPDTRVMKRAGGRSFQGYNAQVVASPEQVIVAADVTQQSNDSGQLAPMVTQAAAALREAGIDEPIGTVLADGGYWNSPQITAVRGQGIDVLVPIENRRRTAPRTLSARRGPEAKRIEAVLSKPDGKALYRRRQQIVEPVFANTKVIRRADRFQRRGLAACRAEWKLIAATHNLLKLWRAGLAVAGTGAAEPLPA
ncbi:MAG: transposase [Solirubrobacterales bacterium]|nr:transposase [Solirubrobacterales bacterium]